jgi:Vanadium chloroperoxidase N-terminal domain
MDDPILYCNDVALEANRVSHTDRKDERTLGPTLSSRAMAIVHLAMYDAFVGASQATLKHYLTPKPATGSSVAAASSTAYAYVPGKPAVETHRSFTGESVLGLTKGSSDVT